MKLKINKNEVINRFLTPISKISDKCIINVHPGFIYTLTNTDNGNIILYGNLKVNTDLPEKTSTVLNIPDVKRLCRIFDCINNEDFELELNSNNLKYDTNDIKFTYHLLDDGIIQKSVISLDKIGKLTFDSSFDLNINTLNNILKGSAIATDSNKIYFYTKGTDVYAELTDKTIQNIDSLTLFISNAFVGTEIKQILPVDLEIFRIFSGIKANNVLVKINTKLKVLMFEITDANLTLKYIVSALVK